MINNTTTPKIKSAEVFHRKFDNKTESWTCETLVALRKYDSKGQITELLEYNHDDITKTEYQYDEQGNEIASTIWEYEDDMVFKTTKEYNNQNQLIHEYTDVLIEDEIVGYYQFYYRYNTYGQLIEFVNDNYGVISVETYEYLFKGNTAIETVYLDGKISKVSVREDLGIKFMERITRYDPETGEESKTEELILFYDDEKRITRIEESDGKISEYSYDEFGNQTEERIINGDYQKEIKTIYKFY